MTFRTGQRVVCIDASPGYGAAKLPTGLILHKVYTIAEVFTNMMNADGYCGVTLVERRKAITNPNSIPRYSAGRFRPLVERKTSIEIFERLLTPDMERVR
jgi:hypothetical protein